MKSPTKILLSIPSIIGLAYMWTFIDPKSIAWISNNIVPFEFQSPIITSLILIQLGYLIYRLWSYKNIVREKKSEWTFLLIIFNVITCLIYIWQKDDQFESKNNQTAINYRFTNCYKMKKHLVTVHIFVK